MLPLRQIAWLLFIKMSVVILVPSIDVFFELPAEHSLSLNHGDKEGESEEKEWLDTYFKTTPNAKPRLDEPEAAHSFALLNCYPSIVLERMVPPPEWLSAR